VSYERLSANDTILSTPVVEITADPLLV